MALVEVVAVHGVHHGRVEPAELTRLSASPVSFCIVVRHDDTYTLRGGVWSTKNDRKQETVEAGSRTSYMGRMKYDIAAMGRRARWLRRSREITQDELASAGGISSASVAQFELGGARDIRFKTIAAVAEALGVSIDELAEAPTQTPEPPSELAKA